MSNISNGTPCNFYPGKTQLPSNIYTSYVIAAVLNNVLAITAAVGNGLILSALWKSSTLHAPSKTLLCGLAFTDLSVGILAQPLAALYYIVSVLTWRALCRHVRSVWFPISTLLSSVSLILMVCISLDRLLALNMSLRYREVVTLKRAVLVLLFAWLVAGPILPLTGMLAGKSAYSYVAAVGITLCVSTASTSFYQIYKKLRHQSSSVQPASVDGTKTNTTLIQHQFGVRFGDLRYKRFVATALLLYVGMLLCYVPYFACMALLAVVGWSSELEAAMAFAETLVMFNSTLNPFLYLCRVREVRNAVRSKVYKIFNRDPISVSNTAGPTDIP